MKRTQQELGLTDRQWEAVLHRLDVPEAIGDALAERFDRFDVEVVAETLLRESIARARSYHCLRRPHPQRGGRGAEYVASDIVRAVLRDCIEGSTWAAAAEGGEHYPEAVRALRGAAKKLGQYLDEELDVPASRGA